MKKVIAIILTVGALVYAKASLALCPLCTIAVAGGVGLSRWLGVDDTITGLWVGGLIVSMIGWTIDWLKKKNWHWPWYQTTVVLGYYLLVIVPLYFIHIFGQPLRALAWLRIDKLTLGMAVGSAVFWAGASWYFFLKEGNDGKVYFPFQRVVLPVAPLIILSFIFYWIIKF
jgi:hypothetical protein